jgi:hypothetical protein
MSLRITESHIDSAIVTFCFTATIAMFVSFAIFV